MRCITAIAGLYVLACGGSPEEDGSPDAPAVEARPDAPAVDGGPDAPPPVDGGSFVYTVTVVDPDDALPAAHADLAACARGGLHEWARYFTGRGTLTVEVRVTETATGRMAGGSTSALTAGDCGSRPAPCVLAEDQAIHRLRTGQPNPNMSGPDVHVDVSVGYWTTLVWVDPDPIGRTATVPSDRLDCVSLFTHELGHALGMEGYRSLVTFQPTGEFLSLFDDLVVVGADALEFHGSRTEAELGPVHLTRMGGSQNVYHYGDAATRSPFDDGLMNGIVFEFGRRYFVGRVDVRILQDLGLSARALPP